MAGMVGLSRSAALRVISSSWAGERPRAARAAGRSPASVTTASTSCARSGVSSGAASAARSSGAPCPPGCLVSEGGSSTSTTGHGTCSSSAPPGTSRGRSDTLRSRVIYRPLDRCARRRRAGREVGAVLVLDGAAVSTRGPRPDNQDSAVTGPLLIAIADGVGGNVGGAVASSLVVNWLAPLASGSSGDGADDPVRVVASANERIRAAYTERPRLRTMATTLTAMHVDAEGIALLHIGDSRGFVLADDELTQVSTD